MFPSSAWVPLVWRCLLGLNCQSLFQPERKSQNRIRQSSDGSRRPPGSWRRSSLIRWCGQDWTTLAEPCSRPSTGLSHLHLSQLSPRQESLGWTLSLSVFSCAGVCICPFLFPCAPADVAANSTCLATIVQRVPWQGSWEGGLPAAMRGSPGVQRGWGTGVHKRSRQRHGPRRLERYRWPQTRSRG